MSEVIEIRNVIAHPNGRMVSNMHVLDPSITLDNVESETRNILSEYLGHIDGHKVSVKIINLQWAFADYTETDIGELTVLFDCILVRKGSKMKIDIESDKKWIKFKDLSKRPLPFFITGETSLYMRTGGDDININAVCLETGALYEFKDTEPVCIAKVKVVRDDG